MKTKITLLALGFTLALGTTLGGGGGDKRKLESIYDTQADGTKLVADALVIAQRDHKRVLVEFGANWCILCHQLHDLLTANPEIAPYFKAHFLLVLVDVNEVHGKRRNAEVVKRYGNPIQDGLPGLVLLDVTGKQLKTQDASEFGIGDHYDPARVMKFLQEWTLKPAAAK